MSMKIIENSNSSTYWYKKYSDGWIEQGGYIEVTIATDGNYTLTFPNAFTAAPISVTTTVMNPRSGDANGNELMINSVTATNALIYNDGYSNNMVGFFWEAKGL